MDERFPAPEEAVLALLLDRQADRDPDRVFAVFEDGTSWTLQELRSAVDRAANALAALGVTAGDRVISWQPNGPEALRTWFAINRLGALYVPVNLAYRGGILEHVMNSARARVAVVHHGLVHRLAELDLLHIGAIVQVGGAALAAPELKGLCPLDFWGSFSDERPPLPNVRPWDAQCIMYTSGTTGPSKGVVVSYMQNWATAVAAGRWCNGNDRYLINLPMSHVGGIQLTYAMLMMGGSIALVESFKADGFWAVVARTQATVSGLVGSMAAFLLHQEPKPSDRKHTLRVVTSAPVMDNPATFAERFGVTVYTLYHMTEINLPIVSDPNPTAPGTCGRIRDGVEIRLVDEFDREVPIGDSGELILRAETPWTIATGYDGLPEATARAWRNGWFHTGDLLRRDAEGNYFFVDRIKDAIRRRGENISSFEVETEVLAHPAVSQCAVVGVPSTFAEDEVLAVVALKPAAVLSEHALFEFLRPRLPHFMLPRYIRLIKEMPLTPTNKIQKFELREAGVTDDTWDREAAGIIIKRESLHA